MENSESFGEEDKKLRILGGLKLGVLLSNWENVFGVDWVELKDKFS